MLILSAIAYSTNRVLLTLYYFWQEISLGDKLPEKLQTKTDSASINSYIELMQTKILGGSGENTFSSFILLYKIIIFLREQATVLCHLLRISAKWKSTNSCRMG